MRKKQKRFQANAASRNVIEAGKEIFDNVKGNWNTFFGNENSIVVELACGRGEYAIGLARLFPQTNFVGVDIKGARIWKGSTIANEEGLQNVAFLRTQIEHIEKFFAKDEIDEIWITFPDPRPRDSEVKKRLTYPKFLDKYKCVVKSGSTVHLKTDNLGLFEYTLEVVKNREDVRGLISTDDLYASPYLDDHYGLQTTYEKKFISEGLNIHYVRFQLYK